MESGSSFVAGSDVLKYVTETIGRITARACACTLNDGLFVSSNLACICDQQLSRNPSGRKRQHLQYRCSSPSPSVCDVGRCERTKKKRKLEKGRVCMTLALRREASPHITEEETDELLRYLNKPVWSVHDDPCGLTKPFTDALYYVYTHPIMPIYDIPNDAVCKQVVTSTHFEILTNWLGGSDDDAFGRRPCNKGNCCMMFCIKRNLPMPEMLPMAILAEFIPFLSKPRVKWYKAATELKHTFKTSLHWSAEPLCIFCQLNTLNTLSVDCDSREFVMTVDDLHEYNYSFVDLCDEFLLNVQFQLEETTVCVDVCTLNMIHINMKLHEWEEEEEGSKLMDVLFPVYLFAKHGMKYKYLPLLWQQCT